MADLYWIVGWGLATFAGFLLWNVFHDILAEKEWKEENDRDDQGW